MKIPMWIDQWIIISCCNKVKPEMQCTLYNINLSYFQNYFITKYRFYDKLIFDFNKNMAR